MIPGNYGVVKVKMQTCFTLFKREAVSRYSLREKFYSRCRKPGQAQGGDVCMAPARAAGSWEESRLLGVSLWVKRWLLLSHWSHEHLQRLR